MHNGVFNNLLEVMAFYNVRADASEVANAIENRSISTQILVT
jgi:cytochrome c peroxidase